MKVAIIAYKNCTASMVLGVLDILSFANLQAGNFKTASKKNIEEPPFDIDIVTEHGGPVMSASGHPIVAGKSISTSTNYDLIYIPGFLADIDDILNDGRAIVKWVKEQSEQGAVLTAACNGNFLLAETGILDRRKATTHWTVATELRNRYQSILLEPEKILIDEGNIISAAGVTAYLNLAIYIVHRFAAPSLASFCSKIFLVDSGRRIQSPYEIFLPRKHGDANVLAIQEWMEKNSKEQISLDAIVNICNLSKRTLLRRFKTATGDTPLVYLQKLRIENAKRLLESTNDTFNEITWKVGYENAGSFQKLFKSETGLSPKEYRMKFFLN